MRAPTTDGHNVVEDVYVGRQPVLDRSCRTVGYELLFRAHEHAQHAGVVDGDAATAHVMSHALSGIGLDNLVGSGRAYVNVTSRFLDDPGLLDCLPPDRVVIEVLEDVVPSAATIAGLESLRARGFTLALDDFAPNAPSASLRDLVDIVKYDRSEIDSRTLRREIERDHEAGRTAVVERIETQEQFLDAVDAGADCVQGYFFARPTSISASSLPANEAALLRLIAEINRDDSSVDDVVDVLTQDVAMSVKVLRVINSAANGLAQQVTSIRHAAVLIGREGLRSWATVVLMASVGHRPLELASAALARAKFCQLVAARLGVASPDSAFTVGLLSLVDALTGRPIDLVVAELPVSDDIAAALLGAGGTLGELLGIAVDLERLASRGGSGPVDAAMFDDHQQAMVWAMNAISGLSLVA